MKKLSLIILLFLGACGESAMEQAGGIRYVLVEAGEGRQEGDYLLMHTRVKTLEDSMVLDTRKLGRQLEVKLSSMDSSASLFQLLESLGIGDSLYMQMVADSFYTALGGQVPPSLMGHEVQVEVSLSARLDEIKYQINKQLFERNAMKRYIEQYGWQATYDSFTGIYYEKLSLARSRPQRFRRAYMSYLIKTLSDRPVAYSKDGEPWVFDKTDSSLLEGLRFVGSQLGGKEQIRALVPSSMAYGSEGLGPVGSFQPIIVEMELLEIID